MAQIETWLKCDLRKAVAVVPLKGHLFSADNNGNLIGVEITENGLPHPVTGTIVLYGMRSDGTTVISRQDVMNTSRPSIVLEGDYYTVVGPIQLVLRLIEGNSSTVLAACTTYVYKTTTAQQIDSGNVVPSLETLIARMNDCEAAAAAANSAAEAAQSQVAAAQQEATNARIQANRAASAADNAASSASSANARASSALASANSASAAASSASQAANRALNDASAAASSASAAAQSASTAQSQVATAQQAASTAQAQVSSANAAATQAQSQASASAESARQAASSASAAAGDAFSAMSAAQSANSLANTVSQTLSDALPELVASAEVRNNALFLLNKDGEVIAGPFSGFGGGGGGGGGSSTATLTFASTSGNYSFIYSSEDQVTLDMTWSSLEDEEPTGNGMLKLTIDSVVKFNKPVAQGTLHENVTQYLHDGDNLLTFQMVDAYGNKKTRSFSITVANLTITSAFDDSEYQYDTIEFICTPFGNLEKVIHYVIDGTQVAQKTVTTYGRAVTQNIPISGHGAHTLTVYYTATMNGESVTSNVLRYEVMCIDTNSDDTIIASSYNVSSVDQYSTVNVPYQVYTPGSPLSNVTISVNGVAVNTLTGVGRERQIFSYRLDESGATTISIASGNAVKLIVLAVNAVSHTAVAETEGLKLHLSSRGRSNNEAQPNTWTYDQNGTEIAATFSGFNWVNDGWVLDNDGITVMRVSGDARITIPYKPFATDKRSTGFTIEIDFATHDVLNADSPILSCMNNGRGIELTSQRCTLTSEGKTINMQFKEEEHVRVAFVVEKRTETRLIYCYINGIMSAATQYPDDDNFAQAVPQNISIGSSNATLDLYTLRIYDNSLGMRQIEDNWIVDTPSGELMMERFGRNNIRNDNDAIVINKLPTDLPYMIITCPELPQYKGDKKTCSGSYTDPINPDKSFTFADCEINVQGTSSQYYYRKNYDMKFNGGFTNSNGVTESKYKMREDSIAVKRFCMKADVASSEGANNVELVRLYNTICPYRTPAQVANSKVRQGIDGFPIVIFWNNPDTNEVTFLGKYNFNNAKNNPEVFGFVEGDESWEMRNSGSNRVLYKDDYFSNVKDDTDEFGNPVASWQKDFECRYPSDEYVDFTQLKEFVSWVKSTDPAQATGDALAETADFGEVESQEVNGVVTEVPITYTHDTAAYRKAKFRAQLSDYAEVQSVIFYYLFTEVFLMIDSRAKNSFPSFIGSAIEGAAEPNE